MPVGGTIGLVDTGPRGRLIRAAEEEGVIYVPGE
jgi:hypothetical protein